jgi:FkbM family methyltransferase
MVYHISDEAKEIRRITKIPRYQAGITKIFGFDFIFVDSASFVGQYEEIYWKQIYNFKSENIRPYILDCGANVGVSIMYFKKIYPDAEITAFEPDKTIFNILKKNVDNFQINNVQLINKGLSNKEGIATFYDDGADFGHILDNDEIDLLRTIEIDTISLRPYLNRKVDFLKIDIEGKEGDLIKDCGDLLGKVDRIFIEYHSFKNREQTLHEILKTLNYNKFKYFIQQAGINSLTPFLKINSTQGLENLLNIFAFKSNT